MIADWTKMFRTPDELADFCLLPVEEQDRLVAAFVTKGGTTEAELTCDISKRTQEEQQ